MWAQVLSANPELGGLSFNVLNAGWESVALDVADTYIFKFPRNAEAARSVEKEARLLSVVRPLIEMAVPDLELFPGPPMFSRHRKIPGSHLLEEDYSLLPESARQLLAEELANFYHQLHRLEPRLLAEAGAGVVPDWPSAEVIIRDLEVLLDPELHRLATAALSRWKELPPDPGGLVYGFFDGHGWNMAFDPAEQRLKGIYDFADSGFGDLHREFIYTDLISRDLTRRVVKAYQMVSGLVLDWERIDLLSGVLRLSDLAGESDHPLHGPFIRRTAEQWLRGWKPGGEG